MSKGNKVVLLGRQSWSSPSTVISLLEYCMDPRERTGLGRGYLVVIVVIGNETNLVLQ